MFRTTILLPEDLKIKLSREAERQHLSFSEMIRKALQKMVTASQVDSFLSSQTLFKDKGPTDVAHRHDDYLSHQKIHGD